MSGWTNALRGAALLLGGLLLAGCDATPPITSCESDDGIQPDCRFQNPEDMVISPGGSHLIVSQMGDMEGHRPGNLVAYQPERGAIEPLFPHDDLGPLERTPGWGDSQCMPPDLERFAPHGIDLHTIGNGRHALYAINHGGRESVEMFEVGETASGPALAWRGCVMAPEDAFFNDLVVLDDGGFWVSHMYPRHANVLWTLLRVQFTGHQPGRAYAWSESSGFKPIEGSQVGLGNGMERAPDGRLFLNDYLGGQVVVIDPDSGERLAEIEVPNPDNSTWAPNGELLVAGHKASVADSRACGELTEGSCGFRFAIVAVDPETYATRTLLEHEGPPMGAATVAQVFGDYLHLGTFAGDRVARVALTDLDFDQRQAGSSAQE